MSPMILKRKPDHSVQFLFKESKRSGVLINLEKYSYLIINNTAQTVWKQINGKNTLHDIAKKFSRKYGLTMKKAEQDVTKCLEAFKKNGFIKFL